MTIILAFALCGWTCFCLGFLAYGWMQESPLPLRSRVRALLWRRRSKFDPKKHFAEARRIEDAVVLHNPEKVAPSRVRTVKFVRRGVDPSK